jgi:hypothetical protein
MPVAGFAVDEPFFFEEEDDRGLAMVGNGHGRCALWHTPPLPWCSHVEGSVSVVFPAEQEGAALGCAQRSPLAIPLPLHAVYRGHRTAAAVPLQHLLRVGTLLSPPRSSVSLFITLNTVLWVHE